MYMCVWAPVCVCVCVCARVRCDQAQNGPAGEDFMPYQYFYSYH